MKTSNKFLVYSFVSIFMVTILFAISLRIHDRGNIHFYALRGVQSSISDNIKLGEGNSSQGQEESDNNGAVLASTQANFSFTGFDKIETAGNWEITIKRGDQYQVKVFADKKILGDVVVEQHGDSLSFSMRNGWFGGFSGRVRAEVILPKLSNIDASGSSRIVFAGFEGDDLSIVISGGSYLDSQHNDFANMHIDSSGSSKITMSGDTFANLGIDLSGGGQLTARGSEIANFSLEAQGASKVDLGDSKVTNATIDLSGASYLKINMNGGSLKGEANGASKVVYSGEVRTQEITTHGASSIVKR